MNDIKVRRVVYVTCPSPFYYSTLQTNGYTKLIAA